MCFDPICIVFAGLYPSTLASDSARYQPLSRIQVAAVEVPMLD